MVLDTIILLFVIHHFYQEMQQFLANKYMAYFSSLWNYIDIIVIILSFATTTFDILSCVEIWKYSSVLKAMHSFTIFFGYLRLLSFARGIEGSSFMIKLIIQVLMDIRYFLLLMFVLIFALMSSG